MEKVKPFTWIEETMCHIGLQIGIPCLTYPYKQKSWKLLIQYHETIGKGDEMTYIIRHLIEKGYDKLFFRSTSLLDVFLYNEPFVYDKDQKRVCLFFSKNGMKVAYSEKVASSYTQLLLLPYYECSSEFDAILEEFAKTGTVASYL